MTERYIINTAYFNTTRTWIFRILRFFGAIAVLYLVDLQELEQRSNILVGGYVLIGLLAIFFLVWPTDELALDKDNLYFIRMSFVPYFSSKKLYKIENFKRVGFYNISKPAGIFALLVPIFNLYRVEMTFKDDSSKSEDLVINKSDLQKILLQAKLLS